MVSALAHYTRPSGPHSVFFFLANFRNLATKKKKKGLANPTNELFEILRKTFAIS
jgi:hypothetical protein